MSTNTPIPVPTGSATSASPTGPPSGPSTARPPTVSPTRPTLSPRPPGGRPSLSIEPTPTGPALVLDGVASKGVEAGCTVFTATDRKVYLLVGAGSAPGQQNVPLGVPLRVRGTAIDQYVSYCQQGTPLELIDFTRR